MHWLYRSLVLCVLAAQGAWAQSGPAVLVVVLDGLRPDYVTPELMPNLHAFGQANVVFEKHHAAYPTVTRLNAATLVTGCFPEMHGLLDNAIYIPEVNPEKALSAADRENLVKVEEATKGNLLTVSSLGELLAEAGKSLFVASSGSSGSAFLLNHKAKGAVVHYDFTLPADLEAQVLAALGPVPAEALPNLARNARVTDAFFKIGVDQLKSAVAILWYSDPDTTAHVKGIGAPETLAALKGVDGEFGRLVAGLKERGLDRQTDIMVVSDHGFSTGTGKQSYDRFVTEYLMEKQADLRTVIRAGYGLYIKENADALVPDLVMRLQQQEWIGAIFTASMFPGAPSGVNPGVMSFSAIQYDHPRAPHILVSPNWSDEPNAAGYKGSTTSMGNGHGSSSPWDIHNTLIAGGPGFKDALRVALPSGNVDIAPTVLMLLGLPKGKMMQGRVLSEAIEGGPDPAGLKSKPEVFRGQFSFPEGEGMTYTMEIRHDRFEEVPYLDYAKVVRTKGQAAPGQFQPVPGIGGAPKDGGAPE